ncbi:MAG: iron-containing alcohol dehydrogenase, partial [Clostridiales bacterium]|nr:iron-containing alcohol dehydrogenase [Clostridiales bacterium]
MLQFFNFVPSDKLLLAKGCCFGHTLKYSSQLYAQGPTASTSMDALTHAIEGYTTKAAWELADCLNLEAIKLISKNLRADVGIPTKLEKMKEEDLD